MNRITINVIAIIKRINALNMYMCCVIYMYGIICVHFENYIRMKIGLNIAC